MAKDANDTLILSKYPHLSSNIDILRGMATESVVPLFGISIFDAIKVI